MQQWFSQRQKVTLIAFWQSLLYLSDQTQAPKTWWQNSRRWDTFSPIKSLLKLPERTAAVNTADSNTSTNLCRKCAEINQKAEKPHNKYIKTMQQQPANTQKMCSNQPETMWWKVKLPGAALKDGGHRHGGCSGRLSGCAWTWSWVCGTAEQELSGMISAKLLLSETFAQVWLLGMNWSWSGSLLKLSFF